MSAPRIKFCGLTRAEDVAAALRLGVDFIGLVLVPGSPRALDVATARALRDQARGRCEVVLLTRDAPVALLRDLVEAIDPDILQFHGREDASHCAAPGRRWWKAVPMGELRDAASVAAFRADFRDAERLLFDSHGGARTGGSGHRIDWDRLVDEPPPWILAGGLDPGTVAEAVARLSPWGVDVSSGIESAPGVKDPSRMAAFAAAARARR